MKQAALEPPPTEGDIPTAVGLINDDDDAPGGGATPAQDRQVLRWLVSYLGRHRGLTALVYALLVVTALLGVAVLPFTKLLMDAIQQLETPERLAPMMRGSGLGRLLLATGLGDSPLRVVTAAAVLLLAVKLVHVLFTFANSYLDDVLNGRILRDMRADLFNKCISMPDDYYHEHTVGEMMTRFIQDLNGAVSIYIMVFFAPLIDLVTLVASGVYLLMISPVLGGITLLFAPLYYFISGPLAKALQAKTAGVSAQFAAVNEDLQETLSATKEIKAHAAEQRERVEFAGNCERHYRATLGHNLWQLLAGQTTRFISEAGPVIILVAGALLIVRFHSITLGTLIVFYGAVASVISSMSSLSNVGISYKAALTFARHVHAILELPREDALLSGPQALRVPEPVDPAQPVLEFQGVSMVYPRSEYRVADLDLRVMPGQMVAIVGEGGAGKSTIFNLLFKLYPYERGSLRLFGQELRDLSVSSVRHAVGLMQQFPFFFQRSYQENLLYGTDARDALAEARMKALAKEYGLDEMVGSWPEGWQAVITNRGANLSGSQQKRSALVRSLMKSPPLLLLDEPLSGLSPDQRREVIARIKQLTGKHTVLVITHDLEMVKEVDRIFVFQRVMRPREIEGLALPAGADELPMALPMDEPTPSGEHPAHDGPDGDLPMALAAAEAGALPLAMPVDDLPQEMVQQGALVEQGTFAELSQHGPVFRRLIAEEAHPQ